MPIGTGAVLTRNLPQQKFEVNPALFDQYTKPADQPVQTVPFPGFGQASRIQVTQEGVVGSFDLVFQGTIVTTGTSNVATWQYPYGLITLYQLSGNGQVNFISCTGYDLYIESLLANRAYTDQTSVIPTQTNLNTAGTYNMQCVWHIPVAMDPTTLIGGLYAQSESTNLTYYIQVNTQASLFTITGGTVAIAGNFYVSETLFDVPYDPKNPDTLVIPDLTVLHGLQSNDFAVAGSFAPVANLFRANAQLERLIFYVNNGTTLMPVATPNGTTGLNTGQIIYGVATTPYTWNPLNKLMYKNNRDYRIALPAGVLVWDAVADNPARDSILLEGTPNIRLSLGILAGTTINAAASIHVVQETLFA